MREIGVERQPFSAAAHPPVPAVDDFCDPERRAVLLVAGDKASQWPFLYRDAIPLVEARYARYLKEREL